jgi:hypothetical protein
MIDLFVIYLEINGADANEPPMYFIAFSGDSGNYENITISSLSFSSSSPLPSSSLQQSVTSSRKPITLSKKSTTTTRTMLLQRKPNPNRRCDQQKKDCQTSTLSSPSN